MTAPLDLDGLEKGLCCLVPKEGVDMPSCHEHSICDCTVLALIARVRELEQELTMSGTFALMKECDSLREKLKLAEEALESTHTSGHHVVAMWGCPACDYFAKIRGQG